MPSTSPIFPRTAFSSREIICGCRRKEPRATTLKYENLARDFGVELGGWSFGAQFGDLNNDGTLDLYLTNGYISLDRNRSYWYDFSKVAGGNSTIIGDAKNWPAFEGRSLSGYQNKRVGSTMAPASSSTSRRRWASPTPTTAAPWHSPTCGTAACSTWSSPIRTGRCCSTKTRSRQRTSGSNSSWKGRPAIAARSARRSRCSGMDSSRCRRFPAAAALPRRTSAACISGWAKIRKSTKR